MRLKCLIAVQIAVTLYDKINNIIFGPSCAALYMNNFKMKIKHIKKKKKKRKKLFYLYHT